MKSYQTFEGKIGFFCIIARKCSKWLISLQCIFLMALLSRKNNSTLENWKPAEIIHIISEMQTYMVMLFNHHEESWIKTRRKHLKVGKNSAIKNKIYVSAEGVFEYMRPKQLCSSNKEFCFSGWKSNSSMKTNYSLFFMPTNGSIFLNVWM